LKYSKHIKEGKRPFWSLSFEELYRLYESNPRGLSDIEAKQRIQKYGRNEIVQKPHISVVKLFLKQFKSPLLIVLIIAALISALMYDWFEAVIILGIVFVSTYISFRQEHSAKQAVEKLKALICINSTVIRDGLAVEIPSTELVPGDVVLLSAGSLIPADGRILESTDLFVSEATLTGESFPVEKKVGIVDEKDPIQRAVNSVFMGTSVRSGTAKIFLTETGPRSQVGRIASELQLEMPENDFERGIRQFSYLLTQIILVLVVLVFSINIIDKKPTFESLLFAIALAVGMTPELLPAIITITLSHGAHRMAEHGIVVKKLNAIETFGSMDVFCTDKTGTLTEGVIKLDRSVDSEGNESASVERLACLNSTFQQGLKNPLDDALVQKAKEIANDFSSVTKTGEIPYDFIRKRLTVAIVDSQNPNVIELISKGAFKQVLAICSSVEGENDTLLLTNERKQLLTNKYKEWSKEGYRVLGVAKKKLAKDHKALSKADEYNFLFCGFLLFYDAPKEQVSSVLEDLGKLGVQLKILTGDNRYVSQHVAKQVGLSNERMITGEVLQQIREEALLQRVHKTDLFVELDPQQKERIIRALKRAGYVVGYLGDGINDAMALYEADVGISVDSAVDVAKDSADLVLMKHDLGMLYDTIREGRITFVNTLKYILTTSSANFGNMVSMAAASAFLPFLPLLAKQILLNNLLSDLPGMSLANDVVDEEFILLPPKWKVRFIRNFMIIFGLVSTLFDFLTFGVLLLLLQVSPEEFRTAWFIESLFTEVLIIFVIRTKRWFFHSKPARMLVVNALAVLLFSFVLPYVPMQSVTGFIPLPLSLITVIIIISILYVIATEIIKKLFYHRGAGQGFN
jgi:Mg2+-importing ATPase